MKIEQFNKLVNETLEQTSKVLVDKSVEYSIRADKLYNFKRAGKVQGVDPKEALLGMWTKHLVSIMDAAKGVRVFDKETLDEKIGDNINYLILLKALLVEEMEENEN